MLEQNLMFSNGISFVVPREFLLRSHCARRCFWKLQFKNNFSISSWPAHCLSFQHSTTALMGSHYERTRLLSGRNKLLISDGYRTCCGTWERTSSIMAEKNEKSRKIYCSIQFVKARSKLRSKEKKNWTSTRHDKLLDFLYLHNVKEVEEDIKFMLRPCHSLPSASNRPFIELHLLIYYW